MKWTKEKLETLARMWPDHSAEEIARKSLKIASEICVYTNDHIICEVV